MNGIPYNYGKYVDDSVKLKNQGTIGTGEQIASPSSAGSRGLAKTTQFTKDPTQMKMGQNEGMTPLAESMIEIRNILNRIDGVNVPVQEDAGEKIANMAQNMTKDQFMSHADELGLTPEEAAEHYEKMQGGAHVQEKEFNPNDERDEAPREGDVVNHKDLGKVSVVKVTGSDQMGQPAEYMVQAKLSYDELMGDVELGKFESAVKEDLDYRSEDILNKAGFDPADIDTYMKVFNDHGDTSDLEQMNMKEKTGLADVMSIVLASHGIQNESYQPFPEGDEFNIEDDEDFEEVLGPLGFPEDETELFDAEYRGRKVPLNKPMRGDVKKFKVYVKDPKTGNVKKVNFGHGGTSAKRKTMRIRKSNPKARKSFRARHNCANPGPKTKARYWSCRKW